MGSWPLVPGRPDPPRGLTPTSLPRPKLWTQPRTLKSGSSSVLPGVGSACLSTRAKRAHHPRLRTLPSWAELEANRDSRRPRGETSMGSAGKGTGCAGEEDGLPSREGRARSDPHYGGQWSCARG